MLDGQAIMHYLEEWTENNDHVIPMQWMFEERNGDVRHLFHSDKYCTYFFFLGGYQNNSHSGRANGKSVTHYLQSGKNGVKH